MEANTGEYLHDLVGGKIFFLMTKKALTTKGKTDQLNSIKIKKFCLSKDIFKEAKKPVEV